MENSEIALYFEKIAFFLKLKNSDKERIKAYEKAAQTALKLETELEDLLLEGFDISSIDGFGKIFAKKVEQLIIFGKIKIYDELIQEYPETLFDLAKNVALSAEEVRLLYEKYKISTTYELRRYYRQNPQLSLPAKTLQKIAQFCEK